MEEWQTSWNNSIGNKLLDIKVSNGAKIRNRYNQVPHLTQDTNGKVTNSQKTQIKPTIGEYQSVVRNIRKDEVVLARLGLGHTRVTHSYLLQGEEQPQCVGWDAPFTVRHAQARNNCFHVDNTNRLFQDIHIDSIMTFLKEINLFNKI